jgi:hypothetical protein
MVILFASTFMHCIEHLLASSGWSFSLPAPLCIVLSIFWPAVTISNQLLTEQWPAVSSILRHFSTAIWREFNHNSFDNLIILQGSYSLCDCLLFSFLWIVALPPPAIVQVVYAALASARDGGKHGSAVGAPVVQSASLGC